MALRWTDGGSGGSDDDDDPEWQPEIEGSESESDDGEDEYSDLRALYAAANAEAATFLSPIERANIDRVFDGDRYFPQQFWRSDHECEQRELVKHERIAHQLRGYREETTAAATPAAEEDAEGEAADASTSPPAKKKRALEMLQTLARREQTGRTSTIQQVKLQEALMPFQKNKHCKVVDYVRDRLYCGGFNSTGSRFLTAGQRGEILLYDTTDWTRSAALPVRDVSWTVTDAKFTPDDRFVMYSSINSNIRMVSVDYDSDGKEQVFPLMQRGRGARMNYGPYGRFGVWCLDMNASGTEFVAGTSRSSVILYDMQVQMPVCHAIGHDDDINAIAFVDGPMRSNVFVSGSDDALIKLWDRRVLSEANPKPQGVFPGHTDGLTYISSRDDGYYFISNSKDQTCKLWDIRKCLSSDGFDKLPDYCRPFSWDYRYQAYPGRYRKPVEHPNDRSVMTYRGHAVVETLIRCHFSPLHSTAQKYVFTGSADGRVYVYDVVSGDLVEVFNMKPSGLTRDVRWHPYDPTIVSPDFYGKLCVWQRHE